MNLVTLNVLPSTSVSLVNTLPVAGVPSATDFVSATATGASFTAVTVIFSGAVAVAVPSVIVTVIVGSVSF